MKTYGLICLLFSMVLTGSISVSAQENYRYDGKNVVLSNGLITRTIHTRGDSIILKGLTLKGSDLNYVGHISPEFGFLLNDIPVTSLSGWKVIGVDPAKDAGKGSGAALRLKGTGPAEGLDLKITYLLYGDLPLIRKYIEFVNRSGSDMKLEAVDSELMKLGFDYVSSWVYHNYARMKHLGPFTGNWDDPVVVIHNTVLRAGIAIGNEAPGVLKRTVYHTTDRNAEAGLTHPGQDFPFRKWLRPGESWQSPPTFIALYNGTDDGYEVLNTVVGEYVRNHMGTRISAIRNKPLFIYNTWNPFRTFVNDSLIREVAKAASECGIQEFIIDDGWQYNAGAETTKKGWGSNYGDWLVDRNKFPGDLSATFDYIRSLGMKPGLWMSIGSATEDASVFQSHPEWFVIDRNGRTGNLHSGQEAGGFYTSCFGTDWFDYIKSVIVNMVRKHGLAYAKLDFSVATSAYVNDPGISGCYATDHPYHRDHAESFIVIYQNVLRLFDELHAEAPDLFIDCTFETAGKLQLQDYAFAKHAEGNWLSNIENPFPTGALRMRQMAWWRSPALPAGSLVIGNLPLDSKNFEVDIKSLIGTLPIILGDPRKLSPEKRASIKKWAEWMTRMQDRYDYMSFRQDLPGFGEPREGSWDGWSRINTDNRKGGIIGVFRHGSNEKSRTVCIERLDPEARYTVLLAPEGKEIAVLTGSQLSSEGFRVDLPEKYDGDIYEISLITDSRQ
ncbi:MAG TPA: alpha-galactosidase [Bacteroidales bacterium]|nr:alpha-galactosidase [Bacteroidales bacterium]HNR41770.1 alpha-galactosidase [Bacteroidales bacterium]HPM17902.1 alpha-galactosidase [Bacteroidales bacterium]